MSDDAWVIVTERDDGSWEPAHPTFMCHDQALVTAATLHHFGLRFRVWDAAKWHHYTCDHERCP